MNKYVERLYNGIIKENPTFVLMLGMCPTLAVTSSAVNGLGMGLSTTVVLICSNLLISLFRKVIPNGVRMPAYIVIVASFVTIVELLLHAYVKSVYDALGLYIPLIGIMFVLSGISVIMQVIYYKRTKKRIFLMAPLHHHFQKKGYSEGKIAYVYSLITAAAGLLCACFV